MKTKFKFGIAAYSGTIDEITYSSYKNGQVCIARKYVKPRETIQNQKMASVGANLAKIYRSTGEDFRNDLKTYSHLYAHKVAKGKLPPNGYAIFIMMMHAFHKEYHDSIGLDSITYGDIGDLYTEITNVKSAVEAGFLPRVQGYEALSATM